MKQILSFLFLMFIATSLQSCAAPDQRATAPEVKATLSVASPAPAENVEEVLTRLESEWAEALVKADIATLDRLVTDDWSFIKWDGQIESKEKQLGDLKSGSTKVESASTDNIKVRAFGDVAVVTASWTEKDLVKGKPVSGTYLYTDVWVKKNGTWQCVATQETKVAQPTK